MHRKHPAFWELSGRFPDLCGKYLWVLRSTHRDAEYFRSWTGTGWMTLLDQNLSDPTKSSDHLKNRNKTKQNASKTPSRIQKTKQNSSSLENCMSFECLLFLLPIETLLEAISSLPYPFDERRTVDSPSPNQSSGPRTEHKKFPCDWEKHPVVSQALKIWRIWKHRILGMIGVLMTLNIFFKLKIVKKKLWTGLTVLGL